MDLCGVSSEALKIVSGVTCGATRAKTVSHIFSSGARLMTSSRSGTTDLMSKSSESTTALNLERSPEKVL